MINYIKKTLYLNKAQFLFFPSVSAGMFAFGHLILWLVMTFDNSEDLTSFELGTAMALFGLVFVSIFGSLGYTNSFNYALTMSQKRTRIITGLALTSAVKVSISMLVIYILNIVERYVCKTAFSEYTIESNMSVIFKPHIILAIICAFVALETIFGALYTKFGIKYFWIVWIGFVLLMQLPSKLLHSDSRLIQNAVKALTNCNEYVLVSVLIVIFLIIISLPYVILKKQRVTI